MRYLKTKRLKKTNLKARRKTKGLKLSGAGYADTVTLFLYNTSGTKRAYRAAYSLTIKDKKVVNSFPEFFRKNAAQDRLCFIGSFA
jgi:recombinational DNA repair protein RecR